MPLPSNNDIDPLVNILPFVGIDLHEIYRQFCYTQMFKKGTNEIIQMNYMT